MMFHLYVRTRTGMPRRRPREPSALNPNQPESALP